MMIISDKILKAREERSHQISDLLKQNHVVVSIKVNFPGQDKKNPLVYLILNSFSLSLLDLEVKEQILFDSLDGPYYLLLTDQASEYVKKKTVDFESSHGLGRFLDIDVHTKNGDLSRKKKRKCFLCDELAHVCVREKTHAYEDLYAFIESTTIAYYWKDLYELMNDAICKELDLDPKFGLVTPLTNGSHLDMDYNLMIDAKHAVLPYMLEIFKSIIFMDECMDYDAFIKIGLKAEKAMYQAGRGVNTYKGLIFHLGLIVLSYGYYLSTGVKQSFQSVIKEMAKSIIGHQKNLCMTFGQKAEKLYHMQGAKGQALSGYQDVIDVLKCHPSLDLHPMLVSLIMSIEDTNLLKRAGGMERYLKIKELFKNLNVKDDKAIQKLTDYCIDNHLTFGGSADLLIIALVIDSMVRKHEKINL